MKFILLAFILSSLSACGLLDPRIAPTKMLDAQHVELVDNGRVLVVQMPFADQRLIKERCGMEKNGYGMDMGSVICVDDPSVWIAKLFVEELRAAGFVVKTEREFIASSDLIIQGSLIKLFAEVIPVIVTSLSSFCPVGAVPVPSTLYQTRILSVIVYNTK